MTAVSPPQPARRSSGVGLSEIVAAMSLAADLGLGQPMEHVLRSCDIAVRFARHVGVTAEDLDATYWVTLLVTAGCTGVSYEVAKLFGDDIDIRSHFHDMGPSNLDQLRFFVGRAGGDRSAAARAKVRAELLCTGFRAVQESLVAHSRISARLADRIGLGPQVSSALDQTFARWDGKGIPPGLAGDAILLPMRICRIAEAVEIRHREGGIEGSVALLRRGSGNWFDPDLVAAWVEVAGDLFGPDPESSWHAVVEAPPRAREPLTETELDHTLETAADFADLKSPWFSGHSRGVAELAATAARYAGASPSETTALRRAALLHDLGRTGIPNTIWDKPGPLTVAEMERVRLHAYYTERVVRRAGRLAPLAEIASAAHERAGGSGYPRGIAGDAIPSLGSLLQAADAYHAMLEARPHRPALTKQEAARELRDMAREGGLRGDAADAVLAAAGHASRRKPTAPAGLTPREIEVLAHIARGATLRSVGERLGISAKTAGNHLERIYAKIGASTRAEATMFAMQHRLLDPL